MRVFADIMGIPQEERREIIRLGNRLVGRQDPEYGVEPEEEDPMLPFSSPVALEMFEIGRRLARFTPRRPTRRSSSRSSSSSS